MKLPHEQLAEDLMKAGLHEMSFAASQYRYHDFRSPLADPAMTLARELHDASQKVREGNQKAKFDAIYAIYKRHMNGEYDATKAESDAWAKGPEGQDAFRRLVEPEEKTKDMD